MFWPFNFHQDTNRGKGLLNDISDYIQPVWATHSIKHTSFSSIGCFHIWYVSSDLSSYTHLYPPNILHYWLLYILLLSHVGPPLSGLYNLASSTHLYPPNILCSWLLYILLLSHVVPPLSGLYNLASSTHLYPPNILCSWLLYILVLSRVGPTLSSLSTVILVFPVLLSVFLFSSPMRFLVISLMPFLTRSNQ